MAVNINVTEDQNSIDINDVNVFTVHVKDLSTAGSIQVSEDTSEVSENIIDNSTVIRIVELVKDPAAEISVNEVDANTVTIITTETNVIEVSSNIAIATAATEAASRKLRLYEGDSLWDVSGDDAVYTEGNVGIGTTSPNSKLDVVGNINATSFTGTFVGALSSSAQIATEISGAFTGVSNAVTINTSDISSNQSNISSNQSNISSNTSNIDSSISRLNDIEIMTGSLSQSIVNNKSSIVSNLALIETQIQASASLQDRVTSVEAGSTSKTLISGSIQLASEISGAFTITSQSLQSRITSVEAGSTSKTLISGSAQIESEISGAFTVVSSSIESRLSANETNLINITQKTLISGSSQLTTEISGAFTMVSASLQDRLSDVEAGSTSKTLISGSAQIATEISGAFNTTSHSLQDRTSELESNVGQDLNTTSDVQFRDLRGRGIESDEDVEVGGDLIVAGTVFGLQGFGVTIDDISITSGSTQFGSSSINIHEFTGSVNITGSLSVTGPVTAESFTGTFVGALSSSTQIATNISGAFVETSSSISSRLVIIESELENTLISGSVQIATEISGAFIESSASITSRLTNVESELENTLISGSAQIATEISGAFNTTSSSLEGRLTTVEVELENTLISGSSQLATEISGAFTETSASITSRLSATETVTGNALISSSAQIAADISGAFNDISFNDDTTLGVVVYDSSAKQFHYTGSYVGATSTVTDTGTTTQYALSTTGDAVDLSKLIINDYSDNVSVTTTAGGILQLTFGTPSTPSFTNFNADGFEPDRFNKEIDDYTLNIEFDLRGTTFVKGELSASTGNADFIGVTEFASGADVNINSSFPSYQSGSHTFKAKVFTTLVNGDQHISTEILDLELNKANPGNPTINFNNFSIPENSYNEGEMEIEEGADGSIDFQLIEGSPYGWTAADPHNSSFDSTILVSETGNITTNIIEEYWTSGDDNSPVIVYTGSIDREWERVRSLRFKSDADGTYPSESELQNLSAWPGTIKTGFNDKAEIQSVNMTFTPTDLINGEYVFIIYDATKGNLSSITNITSQYEEISMFDVADIGNYKVYKKRDASTYEMTYRIEF